MDICIDFDGTCVTHEFPLIGKDIGAVPVLKKLVEAGHRLILFTMRSRQQSKTDFSEYFPEGISGTFLDDAIGWFQEHGIDLYGINENPTQKEWTSSPKAFGQLYIDDCGLNIPLIDDPEMSKKPFVDWVKVDKLLMERGDYGE